MATDPIVQDLSVDNHFDRLCIDPLEHTFSVSSETSKEDIDSIKKWGFVLKEVYRHALRFYKEQEGKAAHFSYQDKLNLVAFTRQVSNGRIKVDSMAPLGVLDVIGHDRRLAWQSLGDMGREQAMAGFVDLLDRLCPLFKPFVEAHKADLEQKKRQLEDEEVRKKEEEEKTRLEDEIRLKEEEEQMKQERQRIQIQEALNQQTFAQFKLYAEKQFPGNPEQQAVLVRQLQDQHYHTYMQQLLHSTNPAADVVISDGGTDEDMSRTLTNGDASHDDFETEDDDEASGRNYQWRIEKPNMNTLHYNYRWSTPIMSVASMWTRKDVKEFKDIIRQEGGDAIIKVGHGETVTVRVPTHEDGTCLFWEFATDHYDIGFGVYFEWSKSPTTQVSVHVSESEEEDDDELDEDDDDDQDMAGLSTGDVERVSGGGSLRPRPPLSIIVPVYRRDCYDEVYAGSHAYPGHGVYLLKFDNSYSLWRSKTLYYRVYYTR